MECKTCQTSLPERSQLTVCPICGETLHPETVRPSFERVWADLQADQLKKKPMQSTFDEAWNWYVQALKSNPEEAVFAVEFLRSWPQYCGSLSLPAFIEAKPSVPFEQQILLWAAGQDPAAALRLAWQDSVCEKSLEDLQKILDSQPDCKLLEPLRLRLKGDWKAARASLRKLLELREDQPLVFRSPKVQQAFSGLSMNAADRLKQMEQAAEKEDLDFLLEALYRPLDGEADPFAHLCSLPEHLAGFLSSHTQSWQKKTADLLSSDQALRGIHLALQTLKNQNPQLAEPCDELLALQYEKAYLRPFSEIENTDRNWF